MHQAIENTPYVYGPKPPMWGTWVQVREEPIPGTELNRPESVAELLREIAGPAGDCRGRERDASRSVEGV